MVGLPSVNRWPLHIGSLACWRGGSDSVERCKQGDRPPFPPRHHARSAADAENLRTRTRVDGRQRQPLLVDTCNGHERILAQFALCPGEDPTYAKIDGAWLDNDAYVTIHRIAASGLVRHAARDCIRWALKHYGNVRADTHPNNKAMQHVLESSGFARCGLIQLLDRPVDTTRIAYQRHEW